MPHIFKKMSVIMQAIPCQAYLLIIKICCTTICLVESHSQGVHANTGVLSVLPHTFHVMLTSVVHCHRKIEYTCVLDCVSFNIIVSLTVFHSIFLCPWLCFIHRDTFYYLPVLIFFNFRMQGVSWKMQAWRRVVSSWRKV